METAAAFRYTEKMIDYRSDTVTLPSKSMRKAMARAEVGDDVLGEDPTINLLQERAAELTGKEKSLFVPSGTFANQLALFTWVPPGGEVYLNENSHIIQHEAGASARISGAFLRPFVPSSTSWAEWSDIAPRVRPPVRDQHFPVPSLICLENALSDGTVQTIGSMSSIKKAAGDIGLPVHLDGARLFNAAAHLKVDPKIIAAETDSLMFCLSKGLGAPVGSLLCGTRDFISDAFYKRKIMGGGMRQAGILAAAGLVALKEELPRLSEDHEKAQELANRFSRLEPFEVLSPQPAINMLFLKLRKGGAAREQLSVSSGRTRHSQLPSRRRSISLCYPPGYLRQTTSRHSQSSSANRRTVGVQMMKLEDFQLFIDLDGVLVDFDRGVLEAVGKVPAELQSRQMWPILAKTPNFYGRLHWLQDGRELWEAVKPCNPVILTGLPMGKWAEPQKRAWCARELGTDIPVITGLSRHKAELAAEWLDEHNLRERTPVLVDDRLKIKESWEDAGGVFILHLNTTESLSALKNLEILP